jgi:thymidylate synthase (FAD)
MVEQQDVQQITADMALVDIMDGASRWEVRVLDHGFLALVDVMPRLVPSGQTADGAIVQAARVSYGHGTKQASEDRGLIRYLMRHRHTSPFEMVELKFHAALPLFVARQWIRHRTANVNEYSGRYSIVPGRFFRPEPSSVRSQSPDNKQGRGAAIGPEILEKFQEYLTAGESLYQAYEQLLAAGVSRELARIGLPQSLYTEWYWKCDLHNVLHFLELRLSHDAQHEIRLYAEAMFALLKRIAPITMEAFVDYRLSSLTLSRLELEALSTGQDITTENTRERREWAAKRERLGLSKKA